MLKYAISAIIIITTAFSQNLHSQEVITRLGENQVIKKYIEQNPKINRQKKLKLKESLTLPFMDDFSYSGIYPDENLWEDNYVFINTSYGVRPPTIGVATFDAVDFDGSMYSEADYETVFKADMLTSNNINLDIDASKSQSLYLSFYYQVAGRGDFPESRDALHLEFYSPETDEWEYIWAASFDGEKVYEIDSLNVGEENSEWNPTGSINEQFKLVMLHINQERFLQDGFKFRFYNKVTLSESIKPSLVGNVDHWNLDYVKLNKDRSANDTIMKDVAFVYPLESVIKTYEAMPWPHFKEAANELIKDKGQLSAILKNNDNAIRSVLDLDFSFREVGTKDSTVFEYGNIALEPFIYNPIKEDFTEKYTYSSENVDDAEFIVQASFKTDDEDPKENNTVAYTQKFHNYYAYDDGTAENGYGITGDGTKNAMLAYKFDMYPYSGDMLRGVQMYFNQTLNNKSQKYFFLRVWDDDNGKPGRIIHSQIGVRPEYADNINEFYTYKLDTARYISNPDTVKTDVNTYSVKINATITELEDVTDDINFKFEYESILEEGEILRIMDKSNTAELIASTNNETLKYNGKNYNVNIIDTLEIITNTKYTYSNIFYIGWKQTTSDLLNIGLDVNRTATDKIFYNVNGEWKPSKIEGALMIRPLLGKPLPVVVGIDEPVKQDLSSLFTLYPNPANDIIFIKHPENIETNNLNISFFDTYGRKVSINNNILSGNQIDIRSLSAGIYFIRLTDNKSLSINKKLLITR